MSDDISSTNERRLASWRSRINEGRAVATILVAVRMDRRTGDGGLHICIDKAMPYKLARTLLSQAAAEFDEALKEKGD